MNLRLHTQCMKCVCEGGGQQISARLAKLSYIGETRGEGSKAREKVHFTLEQTSRMRERERDTLIHSRTPRPASSFVYKGGRS